MPRFCEAKIGDDHFKYFANSLVLLFNVFSKSHYILCHFFINEQKAMKKVVLFVFVCIFVFVSVCACVCAGNLYICKEVR